MVGLFPVGTEPGLVAAVVGDGGPDPAGGGEGVCPSKKEMLPPTDPGREAVLVMGSVSRKASVVLEASVQEH